MKRTIFASTLLSIIGAALCQATPILYTESTTATGSLGGTAFTNALVTITFSGDTANVTSPFSPYYQNATGTATVTVAGFGATSVTTAIKVVVDQNFPTVGPTAGFVVNTATGTDFLDTTASNFSTYALVTAIGPVTGTSQANFATLATGKGNLVISSAGNSTFTAAFVTTPEPVTSLTALFGFGVAGFLGYARRKRAHISKQ